MADARHWRRPARALGWAVLAASALGAQAWAIRPPPDSPPPIAEGPTSRFGLTPEQRERARAMADRAIEFLRSRQDPATGGWGVNPKGSSFPAITGLVLSGMLEGGRVKEGDPAVQSGLKFIIDRSQRDGGIYDQLLPSYNTAICVATLSKVSDPRAREVMRRGVEFLRSLQFGEDAVAREGESASVVGADHAFYGGFGYGRHGRPDLSNAAFAIEALHAAGVEPGDPAFRRAVAFLQRVQMLEKGPDGGTINDQPYAKGSTQGGFIYATSVNKDRVGVGQSFAGEVVESMDGPAGSAIAIALSPGLDGKARTMTRAAALERLAKALAKDTDATAGGEAGPIEFQVVLGTTTDGESSSEFEVRSNATPSRLERLAHAAFAGQLAEPGPSARPLPAWRAMSRLRAYGSMTYSGFKSYLYAGLSKDDPRVVAAREWIARAYTLDENPGLGTDGMYYYYVVLARALAANGEATIGADARGGVPRAWAGDLLTKLETLQNPDGSFRVLDDRWMEDNPVLITAYALIAIECAAR